jgi:hypothetical protein
MLDAFSGHEIDTADPWLTPITVFGNAENVHPTGFGQLQYAFAFSDHAADIDAVPVDGPRAPAAETVTLDTRAIVEQSGNLRVCAHAFSGISDARPRVKVQLEQAAGKGKWRKLQPSDPRLLTGSQVDTFTPNPAVNKDSNASDLLRGDACWVVSPDVAGLFRWHLVPGELTADAVSASFVPGNLPTAP